MYVKKFSLYALLIFNASYIFSMQPPTPTPKPSGWGVIAGPDPAIQKPPGAVPARRGYRRQVESARS